MALDPIHPGLDDTSFSQRQIVVSRIEGTIPRGMASRFSSDMLKRDRASPCSWGRSHARALIAITTLGDVYRRDGASKTSRSSYDRRILYGLCRGISLSLLGRA